jgi:uroporphyrinogen-III synthase
MMADDLLQGLHVAVTRPIDQAESISEAIYHHSGDVISFPLIAISPLENYDEFERVIADLEHVEWAIFISTNAVANALPRILKKFGKIPENLKFAAIGHQTAKELSIYGIHQVLTPHTRFDSETLLAQAEMYDVVDKNIIIFRGVGGRDVLANTLNSRGANVMFAECYRRINPQTDTQFLNIEWQQGHLNAVIVTSSEAMRNLIDMAGKSEWLRHVTLCVNHTRIAELPLKLGFKVLVTEAPGDDAMIKCLSKVVNLNG